MVVDIRGGVLINRWLHYCLRMLICWALHYIALALDRTAYNIFEPIENSIYTIYYY